MKHKHYDLMVKWYADMTQKVQIKDGEGKWIDCEPIKPAFFAVTHNGCVTGNITLSREQAEEIKTFLDSKYPEDKREIVDCFTATQLAERDRAIVLATLEQVKSTLDLYTLKPGNELPTVRGVFRTIDAIDPDQILKEIGL